MDHSTAAPAATFADAGPVTGALAESWHVDAPLVDDTWGIRSRPQPPLLLNGQLIVASPRGIDAYDASTGKARWHYHEPGRALRGYAATNGVLVARTYTLHADDESRDRRIGLDVSTGRILWTGRDDGVGFTVGGTDEMIAGGGVVPMEKSEHSGDVFGVEARSGRTRWKHDRVGGKGCATDEIPSQDNDGGLLLFTERCHDRRRILALDPADGRVRWRKDATAAQTDGSRASVSGGVALVSYVRGTRLFTAGGRELGGPGTHGMVCLNACELATTAGHATVALRPETGERLGRVVTVDTRTGRETIRDVNQAYAALVAAGGQVYGLHERVFSSLNVDLLPAGLDVIDPAKAAVRSLPVPFTMDADAEHAGTDWVGVAGGHVYAMRVILQTVRITAYGMAGTGGPAALDGVPVTDWPDACRLVPESMAPARPVGGATIGSTRLHDVACEYGPGSEAELQTAWVAPSPEQADALFTEPTDAKTVHVPGADEAYFVDSGNELWFRAGRYILRAKDDDPPERMRLAAAAVKKLPKH